jgi:hypothetical protein
MPLPKVQRNVQDQQGNIVPGVLGSVYNQGTGVLASLYSNDAGTVVLANPMTNDATYGSFKFYINPGHYDMTFTKPGYTFEPIYDMQVPQDTVTLGTMATQNANAVAITGGSVVVSYFAADTPTLHVDSTNHRVGIGTQTPGQLLTVVGPTMLNGATTIGPTTLAGFSLVVGPAKTYLAPNLGVGIDPLYPLDVSGQARIAGEVGIGRVPVGGFSLVMAGNVSTNGAVANKAGAGPWGDSSSRSLKTAIEPIVGALALLLRQQGVQFVWTDAAHLDAGLTGQQYGFVLEDVTVPQWLDPPQEGQPPTLTLRGFEALIVEALREVVARLAALEGTVSASAQPPPAPAS